MSWVGEPGAVKFRRELERQREAHVEVILGLAASCEVPAIRAAVGALAILDRVIQQLEEAKNDDDE